MKKDSLFICQTAMWMLAIVVIALLVMDFHKFEMHDSPRVSDVMFMIPALLIAGAIKLSNWSRNL